jgi:hypothetical protein
LADRKELFGFGLAIFVRDSKILDYLLFSKQVNFQIQE